MAPFFSAQDFDMMYQVENWKIAIGFGFFSTMSTVWSSTFTNSASEGTFVWKFEPAARTRAAEKITSSAVKSVPSWNFTFLRRWKRQRVGSGVSQDSASWGARLRSLSRVTRDS